MASEGIPVVLFGKLPLVTTPMTEALLPEVDIIHLIESVCTAHTELPQQLSSASKPRKINPASTKGSNIHRSADEQRRPVAIIVGGGFTPVEFEELRNLEGAKSVVWLRADNKLVPESEWPPNPVYPGRAAERVKEVLRKAGLLGHDELKERKSEGEKGVWLY